MDYTSERLRMLCAAAGFADDTASVVRTYRDLVSPWGDRAKGFSSDWVSEISDDNTPVEFSVAIEEDRTDVRVLFEPQGDQATIHSFRAAGLAFHDRLERDFGANLERFRLLEDLFLPENMQGPFSVWSSVVFSRGRAPVFKAYLNPQACGAEHAAELVEEALARVGLGKVWGSLCERVLRRGSTLDELKYFALDLSAEAEARVKVYARHHAATAEDLEAAASAASSYVPGEALEFVQAMRGSNDRLFARAAFTCSSFVGADAERPAATTVYVPVCAYARDDGIAHARIHDYLVGHRLDSSVYDAIIRGFANRPLSEGVGMQAWAALRRYGGTRLTVYLATEAKRVHPPGVVPAPTPDYAATLSSLLPKTRSQPCIES